MNSNIRLGTYRHYKGTLYQVIGVAAHSESEEELVIYQAIEGEGKLWARPAAMFLETVTINGKVQPRFLFVEE